MPAYFQRPTASGDQGRRQGSRASRFCVSSTSRPRPHWHTVWIEKDEIIAVFDFGGGTFDISVLEVGEGVVEVKSTNGDTHLGGDDVDEVLVGWIIEEFMKDQGIDLHNDEIGASASERVGRKGEGRTLVGNGNRDQSAVHHGGRIGPEAPCDEADAFEIRTARRADPQASRCRRSNRRSKMPA